MLSYEKSIKPFLVTTDINQTVFQAAKFPNVALIYEDVTINKNLKKCKHNKYEKYPANGKKSFKICIAHTIESMENRSFASL